LAQEIAALDLNSTTPLESLGRIRDWQEILSNTGWPPGTAEAPRPARKAKPPPESPGLFDV
jgi:hypothetical protein